jgi:two-component sensor histidine kinase
VSTDLEVALAESVHRARNDLAAIVAMLRLQASAVADPVARDALMDAEARVRALSSLNARLDQQAAGAAGEFDSRALFGGIASDIQAMHLAQRPVTLDARAGPRCLPFAYAKPLGLIVNELVANALKYAFPGGRSGTVHVIFECQGGDCTLTVKDDGIGVDPAAPPHGTGLGRRIVRALASQIGGSFQIGPGGDGGTECSVHWRLAPAPPEEHHR